MAGSLPQAIPFETGPAPDIRGESLGQGPPVVLCHGLSAARQYVVHGSKKLARDGYRLVTYDARGHGESDPASDGYSYPGLVRDLDRVIELESGGGKVILGGHSMGCHAMLAWALANPDRVAALVVIGPAFTGQETEVDFSSWDERADALEHGGPEEFADVSIRGMTGDEKTIRTVWRIARDRAALHRHPVAVAEALREVPRSRPFGSLEELAGLEMPALVVASHDEIDPGHPYEVAARYTRLIPDSELVSEAKGESPLSWQGGKLSRAIASFLESRGLGPAAS